MKTIYLRRLDIHVPFHKQGFFYKEEIMDELKLIDMRYVSKLYFQVKSDGADPRKWHLTINWKNPWDNPWDNAHIYVYM
jgi:hypothetical protein